MADNSREAVPWALPNSGVPAGYESPPTNWLSLSKFRSSLRYKLAVVGAGASIIALSLVAWIAMTLANGAVVDSIVNGLSAVATGERQQIEALFDHYGSELDGVATDTQVAQSLRHLVATGDDVDRYVLNRILSDRASALSADAEFDIQNLDGEILASSNPGNLGASEYDPSADDVVVRAGSITDPSNPSTIRLSSPVIFDGRTVGYVTLHHGTSDLNDIVARYVGRLKTGESFIVARDENGNPRYLTSLRFNEGGHFYQNIDETNENLVELKAISGLTGSGSGLRDYRGNKVFGIYQYIEPAGIGHVVKIDESDARDRLGELGQTLSALIIGISILIVIGALFISRYFVDPISRLTRAADLFSRGKLESRVSVESSDEIGTLGLTFNLMAEKIQSASAELEKRVEERTADLQRSNRDLEQFAYVASHDLQEPLRMISSYTQLLSKRYSGQLDESADEFIGFAVDGAKRMQTLINDLLMYSRSGRTEVRFENIDSAEVMQDVIQNLQSRIEDSGAEVTVGEMPKVVADRQQLISILQNLISNSLKYRSKDRTPRVEVSAKRTPSAWKISVNDNGIGIDPAFKERIFTIFQRLHGREEYQGTGIGLAVVKKLVERSGGVIDVESTPGEGSTFTFTVIDRLLAEDDESDKNNGTQNERGDLRVAS